MTRTRAYIYMAGAVFGMALLVPVVTPFLPQVPDSVAAIMGSATSSPFIYRFDTDGVLREAAAADESDSPYFWLNSGGVLVIEGGLGKTQQGRLSPLSAWRLRYALSNPRDTESGALPQNIFRLVTRRTWDDFSQELRVFITQLNMTETPNRDEWSGILLMSRYQDGDNLYYAGIRMDGSAIIKKKYRGTYYTLGTTQVFVAEGGYARDTNPNLIPGGRWIGIKSEVRDRRDGSVVITFSIDENDSGVWRDVLEVVDDGTRGGDVIRGPAHAGIRTDYLDVYFDDFILRPSV